MVRLNLVEAGKYACSGAKPAPLALQFHAQRAATLEERKSFLLSSRVYSGKCIVPEKGGCIEGVDVVEVVSLRIADLACQHSVPI